MNIRTGLAMAAFIAALPLSTAAASNDCPFVNRAFCPSPITPAAPAVPACNTVDRFAVACYVDAPRATLQPPSRAIENPDGSAEWTDYYNEPSIMHGLVVVCLHAYHHTEYQADGNNQLQPGSVVDGLVYCGPAN